jgi:hypothetical protein
MEEDQMAREHVDHKEIAQFADERVNLKRDDATELRRQANMLRDRLQTYLEAWRRARR